MKSWALIADGEGGPAREADAAQACVATPEGGFVWVHLDGRVDDSEHWLTEHGNLPQPVLGALLATETRPRLQPIGDGALINLRGLGETPDDDPDRLVSIRLWAEQGRIVSVSFRSLAGLHDIREEMAAGALRDPGDLIAALALAITARLDPEVAKLGDEIDECEATLAPGGSFEMRRIIAGARSQAIGYRRFVVPQRQALERLSEHDVAWLHDDDRLHLREAGDRFARMAEELEAIRERSALMHEQLTDLRAELVEARTLTLSVVALIFLPLTFVTGLLGMNVEGIPFAHEPWAFGAVVALCTAAGTAIAGYFIRAHWFSR